MAKHCVKMADAVLKELLNSEFESEWTVVLGVNSDAIVNRNIPNSNDLNDLYQTGAYHVNVIDGHTANAPGNGYYTIIHIETNVYNRQKIQFVIDLFGYTLRVRCKGNEWSNWTVLSTKSTS